MPRNADDHDGPLSRDLRDALDNAINEHAAAGDGLRTAVCAYYDAQRAIGRPMDEITISIQDIFASIAPAGTKGPLLARRKQLLADMIDWCSDGRSP
jgi:hypothetical protein